MKTSKQIKKELQAARQAMAQPLAKEYQRKLAEVFAAHKAGKTSAEEFHAAFDTLHEQYDAATDAEKASAVYNYVLAEILRNNLELATAAEVAPAAVAVWNKYAGKRPTGDKTGAAITEELQKATGRRVYFGIDRSNNVYFTIPDDNRNADWETLRLGPANGGAEHFGYDGEKAQPIEADQLGVWYIDNDYIEKPRQHARDILKQFDKLGEAASRLQSAMDAYNKMTRGNIDRARFGNIDRLYLYNQLIHIK